MSAPRLGLFLSAQHPPEVSASRAVGEHLEQVALVRELGFDSVFAGQHFLSEPFFMFQSVPLLARIARRARDSGSSALGSSCSRSTRRHCGSRRMPIRPCGERPGSATPG